MRNLIARLRERYRWTWVGMAKGDCHWFRGGKDTGIIESVYWNLYQRGDGKRRAKVTGDPKWADSANVRHMQALVKVWISGGPIPPLLHAAHQNKPSMPSGGLRVLKGGKDGAA